MLIRSSLLLLCLLALAGCDKLKALGGNVIDPKVLDAEAVGYACRVSQKTPEACMKENESHSPSSVLNGWKKAEKDIKEQTIDPSMSNTLPHKAEVAASAVPASGETATEGKKSAEKSTDKTSEHTNDSKSDHPTDSKSAAGQRTSH